MQDQRESGETVGKVSVAGDGRAWWVQGPHGVGSVVIMEQSIGEKLRSGCGVRC